MINPKLDTVWNALPRCDRYTIGGKRWVVSWQGGKGTLVPLAEYAEEKSSDEGNTNARSNRV